MGHVLAVPEQAIVVCNGYMICTYYEVQFGTFWTQIEQTSHCDMCKANAAA